MNRFAALLKTLQKLESAAQKQNWTAVDREAPNVERTIEALSRTVEVEGLSEQERETFKSARASYAKILELAMQRRQALKEDLSSINQRKKAQRAYANGKP